MASFTLTDINGALSRLLDVPPGNPALARYAGQLEAFINSNAELQRSGLGGSGFQTIAMTNLPSDVADLMNPAKVQKMQKQLAQRQNQTSAEFAALLKNGAIPFLDKRTAAASDKDSRAPSSGDYGKLPSDGWSIQKLQSYAQDKGVGWIANNPDLLRLGHAAIEALADVNLKRESYQRFKNVGLEDKTIVAGARYAKRNGIDYNEASEKADEVYKTLSKEDKIEHTRALQRLFDSKPENAEAAQRDYREHMDKMREKNPGTVHALDAEQNALRVQKKNEKAATVKADVKEQQASTKEKSASVKEAGKQTAKSKVAAALDM